MKVRLRNSRKKIRRYSHCTKRSATIPTPRKDSPLLHKGVALISTGERYLLERGYLPSNLFCQHGEKDFVASAERFVNIASANKNYCGDNVECYKNNTNCHHNNYSCHRNKGNSHLNNSGFLRLLTKRFVEATK